MLDEKQLNRKDRLQRPVDKPHNLLPPLPLLPLQLLRLPTLQKETMPRLISSKRPPSVVLPEARPVAVQHGAQDGLAGAHCLAARRASQRL